MTRKKKIKMYKVEIYTNEQEWLNARGLGGSSASAILDSNPYMTKHDLWLSILNKDKKTTKKKKNDVQEYGHKAEPLIRKLVALNLAQKYKIIAPKKYEMYRRVDKPYLTATIDSTIIRLEDGVKGIHEIKTRYCKNREEYEDWLNGVIPQNYFIQCLHYLMVMEDMQFVLLTPKLILQKGFEIHTETIVYGLTIWRKDVLKELEYLEKVETEFWENNIIKRQIPTTKIKLEKE